MKMKYLPLLGIKQAQFSLFTFNTKKSVYIFFTFVLHVLPKFKAKKILNQNTCCTALASSSAMPFIVPYITS